MTTTNLLIDGISCASCVAVVEKALLELPGVDEALVNLAERTATVKGSAAVEDMIKAVKKAGYGAERADLVDEEIRESRAEHDRQKLWLRSIIAGSVGCALFVAMLLGMLPTLEASPSFWLVISLMTLLILIFIGGNFFVGAWRAILNGRGNMDTLVAMGTGTAWLYSTAVVLYPQMVPASARYVYFEAAIIIIALVSLGSALEMRARGKTSQAIKRLIGLQPDTARVIRQNQEVDVPIDQVELGETIRIRPGERIAVDGVIVDGTSNIDESMLTGEPMPVQKQNGDPLYGGTINLRGSFLMHATRIGRDTALARIIELVRNAQASKPAIARLVDKVAAVFVPFVILVALVSFTIWFTYGPQPELAYAIVVAMTVMVIACPCALGLATPISIMVGVGRAAEAGILIRNGEALQQAARVNTVVFDKTGTLTQGQPQVTALYPIDGYDPRELLRVAASLESNSEHPLAGAIIGYAKEQGIEADSVDQFEAISGEGVRGLIDGTEVLLGNQRLMSGYKINSEEHADILTQWAKDGATPVLVAIKQKLAGIIAISDAIRKDSLATIDRLHKMGVSTVMLTGDNRKTAEVIAQKLNIKTVIAEVLPADKDEQIKRLQKNGSIVAMVGDGINDAPALVRADVGIAIGAGTDIAIDAADIALMRDSVYAVADCISLSRVSMKNIKQNLFGAFIYNIVGIPIAAGVLYPAFGVLLNPIVAAAAMSMSSVTVVSNALRLRKISL